MEIIGKTLGIPRFYSWIDPDYHLSDIVTRCALSLMMLQFNSIDAHLINCSEVGTGFVEWLHESMARVRLLVFPSPRAALQAPHPGDLQRVFHQIPSTMCWWPRQTGRCTA